MKSCGKPRLLATVRLVGCLLLATAVARAQGFGPGLLAPGHDVGDMQPLRPLALGPPLQAGNSVVIVPGP